MNNSIQNIIGINLVSENIRMGGIANYVKNLLKNLADITLENNMNRQFVVFSHTDYPLDCLYGYNHFQIVRLKYSLDSSIKRRFYEQTIFPDVLTKYKVKILHSINNTIPLLFRGKNILTIHDLSSLKNKDRFSIAKMVYLRFFSSYSAKLSNHIISVSQATTNDIIDYFSVNNNKISTIAHGVNDCFKPRISNEDNSETLLKYKIQTPFLFFTGTMEPGKNIPRLYTAFRKVKDNLQHNIQLVLAGYNDILPPDVKGRLLGDEDVRLTGFVPASDLPILYRESLATILVSLNEGFGLPVIEAMASGVPVIASNVSSLPEVAGDAALLVNPTDIEEIASSIEKILLLPDLRKNLSLRGLQRAKLFSWTECAKKTLDVYNKFRG